MLIWIGLNLLGLVRNCQDWSALVRIGKIFKTKCDDTTTDLEFNWSFLKKISWSTLQRKHYMAAEKYFYLQPWISDEDLAQRCNVGDLNREVLCGWPLKNVATLA